MRHPFILPKDRAARLAALEQIRRCLDACAQLESDGARVLAARTFPSPMIVVDRPCPQLAPRAAVIDISGKRTRADLGGICVEWKEPRAPRLRGAA